MILSNILQQIEINYLKHDNSETSVFYVKDFFLKNNRPSHALKSSNNSSQQYYSKLPYVSHFHL